MALSRRAFPNLESIDDPVIRDALRIIMDRIHDLESQGERENTQMTRLGRILDANGNRITNLGDATEASDAISRSFADNRYQKILRTPAVSYTDRQLAISCIAKLIDGTFPSTSDLTEAELRAFQRGA